MMEIWKDLLDRGWRFNADVISSFDVPRYEFNRFRMRIRDSYPKFYRDNVFKREDRRLLLSPKMVEIMKDIYDSHRWKNERVCDDDFAKALSKFDEGNDKNFKEESFYKIDFNGEDFETIRGMVDEKISHLDDEIRVLNDYKSNLLEFRDKVVYLSEN
ncbi:hypothetical protein [Anaerococcus hydrogenalis]|uniref:Uncharacterized protein n=1 Tax=Anaerococcus hydrogenalis TaxID=33029 RepID=A0A2N6UIC5_9FIRM|nr:hypothetical protein [Anaerococcus hydrogenalis]MDK7694743.1 hypothetical protein [Anaerococcus hydrogenalis]MDK7696703.1 hypothetical protein [Anaerococcus hydrogenalis]MDK7707770.1 hypothetical protein [Anaerococcus hydrogenalis]PMC81381.1 hypothetical protein CJ192_04975 [Anaerococcus hydrogenalis]